MTPVEVGLRPTKTQRIRFVANASYGGEDYGPDYDRQEVDAREDWARYFIRRRVARPVVPRPELRPPAREAEAEKPEPVPEKEPVPEPEPASAAASSPPVTAHHTGYGRYELRRGDEVVDRVRGKAAAHARAAELNGS